MTGAAQDTLLRLSVGDFVLLDDHVLLQYLDRVQTTRGFIPAQDHLTEGALAKHLQELETFERDLPLAGGFRNGCALLAERLA